MANVYSSGVSKVTSGVGGQIVMRPQPPDTFLLLQGSWAAPLTSPCLILNLRSLSPILISSFSDPRTPQKMQIPHYRDKLDWFQGQRSALLSLANLQANLWYGPQSLTTHSMVFNSFTIVWIQSCSNPLLRIKHCYTSAHHFSHYWFEY